MTNTIVSHITFFSLWLSCKVMELENKRIQKITGSLPSPGNLLKKMFCTFKFAFSFFQQFGCRLRTSDHCRSLLVLQRSQYYKHLIIHPSYIGMKQSTYTHCTRQNYLCTYFLDSTNYLPTYVSKNMDRYCRVYIFGVH
jgi:hypothetical protein